MFGVIILTVSGSVIKVIKWGCFPLTHHLGGDFDHGKIMRPVILMTFRKSCNWELLKPGAQFRYGSKSPGIGPQVLGLPFTTATHFW